MGCFPLLVWEVLVNKFILQNKCYNFKANSFLDNFGYARFWILWFENKESREHMLPAEIRIYPNIRIGGFSCV